MEERGGEEERKGGREGTREEEHYSKPALFFYLRAERLNN